MPVLGPNAAKNLKATVTDDSMTVSWPAPTGTVGYYEVWLQGKSDTKRNVTQANTSTTFTDLTAGKQYTVLLVTVSGDQRSTTAEEKFYTSKCVFIPYRMQEQQWFRRSQEYYYSNIVAV